jgi:hypothetical protein
VNEADADHHRYRALLRDADDEPKRLALIQLLIEEGARDKLAARLKASRPEPVFERQPVVLPVPMHREVPEKAVESGTRQWPGEATIAGPADDASRDPTPLAAPPSTSVLAPPALASGPPEPTPYHDEVTEPAPQSVASPLEMATGGPVALTAAEPSRHDDLADRVATPVSGRAASANAGPAAAMASRSGTPPAASDVEIASRIQAALAELTRVHRQLDDLQQLGGGEARPSLPAPSGAASPEATRSVSVVRASTHDLIDRFVRLMSGRLAPPAAALPSASVAPPSDNAGDNSIAAQIQAALAKQKGSG